MTRVLLVLVIVTVLGCGGTVAGWSRYGQPVDKGVIQTFPGAAHCDSQGATFLVVGWPLGTRERNIFDARWYVRNPPSFLQQDLLASFADDVKPARDAAFTGYSADGFDLWLAPSDQDSQAYVKVQGHFERWPRARHALVCA
jgi:hypothetical protein